MRERLTFSNPVSNLHERLFNHLIFFPRKAHKVVLKRLAGAPTRTSIFSSHSIVASFTMVILIL